MRKMMVPVEEIFIECKFGSRVINCTESFQEVIIGYKMCYTFNGLELIRQATTTKEHEWSVDGGYKSTTFLDTYPYRSLGAGAKFGLSLLLQSNEKYNDWDCSILDGFVVGC
jgi:Amiloride-sensitive sodium channel